MDCRLDCPSGWLYLRLVNQIPYTVRRSARARHARIVVDAGGVEVVVPERMALKNVPPLVKEKRRWIERTLRRFREAEASVPAARLDDGGVVPYLGRAGAEGPREPARVRDHVARRGDVLHVARGAEGADAVRGALERWYRRRARAEVAPRFDAATRRAGHELLALHDPRPAHPLGQLLLQRRDELQLAAAAGPAGDPRLRGGARGGPPPGARPFAALLAAARLALPGLPRARALAAR